MSSEEKEPIQLLQGTLDLIVLRTLASMGAQHAYQIATRLQQVSDRLLNLTESNREAKYYAITKGGEKALNRETLRWRKMSGLVERLLLEDFQP